MDQYTIVDLENEVSRSDKFSEFIVYISKLNFGSNCDRTRSSLTLMYEGIVPV